MYRVMIVDDEILVRVGLKSTIDWRGHGFEIIAEAPNGEAAWEQFQDKLPEVVLTDIKMPKMDGLQLTERIKALRPETKVVILTCHDEFAFARDALKKGADNYVLKSEVEDEELVKLIDGIRLQLDAEAGGARPAGRPSRRETGEQLLADLLSGMPMASSELAKRLGEAGGDISFQSWLPVLMRKDVPDSAVREDESDAARIHAGVMNLLGDMFGERELFFLSQDGRASVRLVIGLKSASAEAGQEAVLQLRRVMEAIRTYLNLNVSAVVGTPFRALQDCGAMLEACSEASTGLFYAEPDEALPITDMVSEPGFDVSEYIHVCREWLISQLTQDSWDDAMGVLSGMDAELRRCRPDPKQLRIALVTMINEIRDEYRTVIGDAYEKTGYANDVYLILNAVRLSDVSAVLRRIIGGWHGIIRQFGQHSNQLVHQAVLFIESNIGRKISLESVAEEISLSKSYMCTLFKRETGENMSAFINRLRVEKAMELLRNRDCKVKEIYDTVGFSDPQYFSRVFKKVTGISVMEYRQQLGLKS